MNNQEFPNQRFTGYWIPVELSNIGLSKIEQFLLSIIDSLDSPAPDYCFASNSFLAEQMELSESRISFYLTKFKRMGLIKEVAFDGRRRRMTCIKENWYSKKELCVKTRSQGKRKHEVRVRENTNHIVKKIEKTKEQQQEPIGSVAVFHELMKKIEISDKDKESIIRYAKKQKLAEEDFANAINFVTRPEFEVNETLTKAIMWALKVNPELPEPVDAEENKDYARSAEGFLESKSYNLEALSQRVVINSKTPTNPCEVQLMYSENDFKNKLEKLLKEHRFTKRIA